MRQTLGHMRQSRSSTARSPPGGCRSRRAPGRPARSRPPARCPTEADQSATVAHRPQGPSRRGARPERARWATGRGADRRYGPQVRRRGQGRVPTRAVGVAHRGAHGPARQDARGARPAADGGRSAGTVSTRRMVGSRADLRPRRADARPAGSILAAADAEIEALVPGSSRRGGERPRGRGITDGTADAGIRAHPVDLPHTAQRPGISSCGTHDLDGERRRPRCTAVASVSEITRLATAIPRLWAVFATSKVGARRTSSARLHCLAIAVVRAPRTPLSVTVFV